MGTFAVLIQIVFKIYIRDIWFHLKLGQKYLLGLFDSSTWLNDEIDTFTGTFKLGLDLMDLDKYLTYGFDGQRFTGINNTNLIIFML